MSIEDRNFIKRLDREFVRFLIVGVINTVVGTAIMLISYNLIGLSYWASSALNYILASILSYFLNREITFKSKDKSGKTMVMFALNIVICYLLAYSMARPIIRSIISGISLRLSDNISMLLGMCIFVVLNYMGQRLLVFKADR